MRWDCWLAAFCLAAHGSPLELMHHACCGWWGCCLGVVGEVAGGGNAVEPDWRGLRVQAGADAMTQQPR